MNHSFVIWGAGHRGKTFLTLLGKDKVIAFIDMDKKKNGSKVDEIPVISYDFYKEKYLDYPIIISPLFCERIIETLKKENILFFTLLDCPPECVGFGWAFYRNMHLQKIKPNYADGIQIYGCSLYSIFVYEWLVNNGYKDIVLVPHESIGQSRRQLLNKIYRDINFQNTIEINDKTILATIHDATVINLQQRKQYIDIYDWTLFVNYKNPKIEKMKNKHYGKRCFIIATGPSLNVSDLKVLKKNREICISMNSIWDLFPDTNWRPDYYVVLDAAFLKLYEKQILNAKLDNIFIADSCVGFQYENVQKNTFVYHPIINKGILDGYGFSEDCSEKIYHHGSVTHICVQLAAYLGFKEIYLLGVDFDYRMDQKCHFAQSIEDNTFPITKEFVDEFGSYELKGYEAIQKYAKSHALRICNATRGGKLEVFERVNFNEIFL